MNRTPQLSFSREWDRWVLTLPKFKDDDATSYECVIDYSNGESQFRFVAYQDGDWFEVYTSAQYQSRVEAIVEHEGNEAALIWHQEQTQVILVRNNHPVFDLQQHWEAMLTLGLFTPMVTMRAWKGKALSVETRAKIDAARDKWMQAAMEDHELQANG